MKTNKEMVFEHLSHFCFPQTFFGRDLRDAVFICTDRNPYVETVLRYAREYCKKNNGKLLCIDRQKSKYIFYPSPEKGMMV